MEPLSVSPETREALCRPICAGMWSITPYARCDHRCRYCCTTAQGRSEPMEASRTRSSIQSALEQIPPGDLLIFGAFSDAYPNAEATEGVTRRILETAIDLPNPVTIVTKGDTVLRDIDLLGELGPRVLVQVSICTTDEAALATIDPGAPSGHRRFAVIETLATAGIRVELNGLPWIPGVTDVIDLLDRLPEGTVANFSPLSFGSRATRRLLGRTFTRSEVWEAYLADYARHGHLPTTSWIRPSLPPEENHPLARLPVLAATP